MAKHVNPSVLGGFVLGGIALLIAAIFLFGGRQFFQQKAAWVTFFQGSVGGLTEGAPVTFRGVPVGKVTKVEVQVNARELTARIPVYFEIDRGRIAWIGGDKQRPDAKSVIAAGLRTKLAVQSFVTGQMMVELDIVPGSPATLVGADPHTPELPSVVSEIDVLKQELSNLPMKELVADIDRAVNSLNHLVQSPDVGRSVKEMADTLAETRQLMASLNENSRPLLEELEQTARATHQTATQATNTLRSLQTSGTATLADARTLLGTSGQTVNDLRTTLASINELVAEDTVGRQDIEGTLDNLNKASVSLRGFASTLERNPNAVIIGK